MNFTLRFESIPSIYLYLYYLSMQFHFALESRLPYVHSTFNVLKYLEDVPREYFCCHIVTARDAGHQVQEGLHLQLGQVNYNPELIHICACRPYHALVCDLVVHPCCLFSISYPMFYHSSVLPGSVSPEEPRIYRRAMVEIPLSSRQGRKDS